MKMRPGLVLLLVVAFAGLVAAIAAVRLARAEARADGALAQLDGVARDASEVMRLRSREEVVALSERPKADVYAQISRTLLDVGIASGALRDLSPEGDRTVDGASAAAGGRRLRTQSMRFSLEPITPAQLGAFLSHWSIEQRAWRVAGIELVHLQGRNDDSYTCRLTITATYLAAP